MAKFYIIDTAGVVTETAIAPGPPYVRFGNTKYYFDPSVFGPTRQGDLQIFANKHTKYQNRTARAAKATYLKTKKKVVKNVKIVGAAAGNAAKVTGAAAGKLAINFANPTKSGGAFKYFFVFLVLFIASLLFNWPTLIQNILLALMVGSIFGLMFLRKPGTSLPFSESLKLAWSKALPFTILAAIFGLVLSLFTSISVGYTFGNGIFSALSMMSTFAAITFVLIFLGSVISYAGGGGSWSAILAGIAIVGLLILIFQIPADSALINTGLPFGQYMKTAMDPVKNVISIIGNEIGKYGYCMVADSRCPFLVSWEEPVVERAEEKLNMVVQFSDKKIKDDYASVLVSLTVTNPELDDLEINPRCWIGTGSSKQELIVERMGKYSKGDYFEFGPSEEARHTTFRCSGPVENAVGKMNYNEKLTLKLERKVSVDAVWPIYLGSEPHFGLIKTIMPFIAPYTIALGSSSDMPFEEGEEYDFQIALKRYNEDTKLEKLEYLRMLFPDDVFVDCPSFDISGTSELSITSVVRDELMEIATDYEEVDDRFIFSCLMYISSAPRRAVQSPIDVHTAYIVSTEYTTFITKSLI
ncbi:MAG: hypothetical protein ABH817_01170 [archaeon]